MDEALRLEEARLFERPGRELGQLLREAKLLRRQDEPAAARRGEKAEDGFAGVKRKRHPLSTDRHPGRRRLVVEDRPVRREASQEDVVGLEGAPPAGRHGRGAVSHRSRARQLFDLACIDQEAIRLDAVELQLAGDRGDGEADDFLGVQGSERTRGELEEGDGLLAALHERGESPVTLEDMPHRPCEEADGLVHVLGLGRGRKGDSERRLRLLLQLHGSRDIGEAAVDRPPGASLCEDLLEVLREPPFGGGRRGRAAGAEYRRHALSGEKRHDRGVEKVERGAEDPVKGLVEKESFLQRPLERLEEGQFGRAVGCHQRARAAILLRRRLLPATLNWKSSSRGRRRRPRRRAPAPRGRAGCPVACRRAARPRSAPRPSRRSSRSRSHSSV